MKIGDFGCGEGKLQLRLVEAGHPASNIHSFDAGKLPGCNHVIQCDIAKLPLADKSLDVGVFCLSLMGTNFPSFITEANRVLKPDGKLFVAEVVSRFENKTEFMQDYMPQCGGFTLLKSAVLHDFFYLMVFKKDREVKDIPNNRLMMGDFKKQLKPCIYKRR